MFAKIRLSLLAFLLILQAGCAALYTTNAAVPTENLVAKTDIPYGAEPLQKLDVYQPRETTAAARPVILFFYGGSWQSGQKKDYLFVGESFADAGYVTVVADYRKYPQVKSPEFLRDAAKALRWTKDNISQYNGDPNKIFLAGHSAGGHIAVLSVLDTRYLNEVGLNDDFIAGIIGLSGPYDFKPSVTKKIAATFGPPSRFPESQPVNYARADAPPLLLVHGAKDSTVAVSNAINLDKAIKATGGRSQLAVLPDDDHVDPLMGLTRLVRSWSGSRQIVLDFINTEAAKH